MSKVSNVIFYVHTMQFYCVLFIICTNKFIEGCIKKFRDWAYRLECIYLI